MPFAIVITGEHGAATLLTGLSREEALALMEDGGITCIVGRSFAKTALNAYRSRDAKFEARIVYKKASE
jgi:3-isopropylmalate dehydratase small subunit